MAKTRSDKISALQNHDRVSAACGLMGYTLIVPPTTSRNKIVIWCSTCMTRSEYVLDTALRYLKKDRPSCKVCYKLTENNDATELSDDQYVALAHIQHQYKYLYPSLEITSDKKITVICPEHGSFSIRKSAHVVSGQCYGCQKCASSQGERLIMAYLNSHQILFETEKTFDDLVSPKLVKLRYDFYLPSLNCLIEFDGKHHFEPTQYGTRQTKEQQQEYYDGVVLRDKMKTEYAQVKNIKLIRIPYTEKANISQLLDKGLNNG